MVRKRDAESETATQPEPQPDDGMEPIETVDLVGGALCLDFTNTGSSRRRGPFRERLKDYEDLLVWSGRVGLVDEAGAAGLAGEAARRPADAERVLSRARVLREALYRVFSAHAHGVVARPDDVAELNGALAEAGRLRRLVPAGDGWTWMWERGEEPLLWPLWPVVQSAAELLTDADPDRIKECGSDNCNWLFYDASKNRSRRWCEMKDCGNRAKQRRHRSRTSGGVARRNPHRHPPA